MGNRLDNVSSGADHGLDDLTANAPAAGSPAAEQALNGVLESEIISDFTSNSFLYGEEDEEGKFY